MEEEKVEAGEWPGLGVFEGMEDMDPNDTEAILAKMPQRFIDCEKGNVEKGKKRWLETIAWRRENDMKNILRRPHPKFHIITKHYPHWFHLKSAKGLPCYYEQPGKINLKALKKEGITMEDLLYHYRFITEFLWVYVNPHEPPQGQGITVLDIDGITMTSIGGQVLEFIKKASSFTGAHYPERCAHIFILNVPWYFNRIWKMLTTFLDPVTVAKTHLVSSDKERAEMQELIGASQPVMFGGKADMCPLGESPETKQLLELIERLNSLPQ